MFSKSVAICVGWAALGSPAFAGDHDDDASEAVQVRRLCVVTKVASHVAPPPLRLLGLPDHTQVYAVPNALRSRDGEFERIALNGSTFARREPGGIAVQSILDPSAIRHFSMTPALAALLGDHFFVQSVSRSGDWVFVRKMLPTSSGALLHLPSHRAITAGFEQMGPLLWVDFTEDESAAVCNRGREGGMDIYSLDASRMPSLPHFHLPVPNFNWQFRYLPRFNRLIATTLIGGPFVPTTSRIVGNRGSRSLGPSQELAVLGAFQISLPGQGGTLQYERVDVSPSGRYLLVRKIFRRGIEVVASGVDLVSAFGNTWVASFERLGTKIDLVAMSPNERLVAMAGQDGVFVFDVRFPTSVRFELSQEAWGRRILKGLGFADDATLAMVDSEGIVHTLRLPSE